MSIHKKSTKRRGTVWEVRWRESGRNRGRRFYELRDARMFQAQIRRRKSRPVARRKATTPLAPANIEALRAHLLATRPSDDGLRDATAVSVMAYAGLRPGELRALRWADVQNGALFVSRMADTWQVRSAMRPRHVKLLAPVAEDLDVWREKSCRSGGGWVFPGRRGEMWSDSGYRRWAGTDGPFRRACVASGVGPVRPFDLRMSCAALLFVGGWPVIRVAEQMGFARAVFDAALRADGVHVVDDEGWIVDPVAEIRAARAQVFGADAQAAA